MTEQLNFDKLDGLVPAVIQDVSTRQVLMVGFMNREAVERTLKDRKVTFWSRTKQRLWQKGESSGNLLRLVSMQVDCDGDALLIQAESHGPVCHSGSFTCFGEGQHESGGDVLERLERIILDRKAKMPTDSHTSTLFREGAPRIAQKVGEEAVEVIIASLQNSRQELSEESADLLFHLMVLLAGHQMSLSDVVGTLEKRMRDMDEG